MRKQKEENASRTNSNSNVPEHFQYVFNPSHPLKDVVHNVLKTILFLTVLSTIELQGKLRCYTCQGLELT